MAKYSRAAQESVENAMHEFKRHELKSGRSGKVVRSRKQAIAIGLSEARQKGQKAPKKRIMALALTAMSLCAIVAQAATYADPIEGRLRSVYSDFITLTVSPEMMKSPDINTSNGGELAFKVDSQTGYDNIAGLTDLKEGDKLKVEYKEEKGKNIATMISKLESAAPANGVAAQQTTTTVTTTTVTVPETPPDSSL